MSVAVDDRELAGAWRFSSEEGDICSASDWSEPGLIEPTGDLAAIPAPKVSTIKAGHQGVLTVGLRRLPVAVEVGFQKYRNGSGTTGVVRDGSRVVVSPPSASTKALNPSSSAAKSIARKHKGRSPEAAFVSWHKKRGFPACLYRGPRNWSLEFMHCVCQFRFNGGRGILMRFSGFGWRWRRPPMCSVGKRSINPVLADGFVFRKQRQKLASSSTAAALRSLRRSVPQAGVQGCGAACCR
ncbi:hypothetical protein SSTU70S_05001 [Stutzerimonas stutzeri]